MITSLEEYIQAGLSALNERKSALIDSLNRTTNPLDRLSLGDRVNEINICISYFEQYTNYSALPANKAKAKD